jgi:hypothetical protein
MDPPLCQHHPAAPRPPSHLGRPPGSRLCALAHCCPRMITGGAVEREAHGQVLWEYIRPAAGTSAERRSDREPGLLMDCARRGPRGEGKRLRRVAWATCGRVGVGTDSGTSRFSCGETAYSLLSLVASAEVRRLRPSIDKWSAARPGHDRPHPNSAMSGQRGPVSGSTYALPGESRRQCWQVR